jgi:FAD binding domain
MWYAKSPGIVSGAWRGARSTSRPRAWSTAIALDACCWRGMRRTFIRRRGGQGLNTSVQDAYNLGWKLAHAVRVGTDSLLDTYEAERLPIAASVLGLTKRLHLTRSIKRGETTDQLALHYRASPLSSGAALGSLHAGDRMPDARLDDGGRLFDRLRGPHATELVTPEGHRILIRPDGYIAHIGSTPFVEYAGEPTRQILGRTPQRGAR